MKQIYGFLLIAIACISIYFFQNCAPKIDDSPTPAPARPAPTQVVDNRVCRDTPECKLFCDKSYPLCGANGVYGGSCDDILAQYYGCLNRPLPNQYKKVLSTNLKNYQIVSLQKPYWYINGYIEPLDYTYSTENGVTKICDNLKNECGDFILNND